MFNCKRKIDWKINWSRIDPMISGPWVQTFSQHLLAAVLGQALGMHFCTPGSVKELPGRQTHCLVGLLVILVFSHLQTLYGVAVSSLPEPQAPCWVPILCAPLGSCTNLFQYTYTYQGYWLSICTYHWKKRLIRYTFWIYSPVLGFSRDTETTGDADT